MWMERGRGALYMSVYAKIYIKRRMIKIDNVSAKMKLKKKDGMGMLYMRKWHHDPFYHLFFQHSLNVYSI